MTLTPFSHLEKNNMIHPQSAPHAQATAAPRRPGRRATTMRASAALALLGLAAALTCLVPQSWAAARTLQRVPVAAGHDPLYVDANTIQRSGMAVRFTYVLDVPDDPSSTGGERRYHSNAMDASIDCSARTFSFFQIRAYAGTQASGKETGGYTPTAKERLPEPIVKGGTTDFLFDYLCK